MKFEIGDIGGSGGISYVGVVDYPSPKWTDNGGGSITIGQTHVMLHDNANYVGVPQKYVVAKEMDDTDSDLYAYVTRLGEAVQQRVVDAAANAHQRSVELEARLTEAAAIDDAEVAEYAKQKALKSAGMTLIESLFVINRKSLSEATESDNIPTDLVMAESISQYTVLETVSALGIAPIDTVTRDMLVKSLAANTCDVLAK